jgi:lipid II:glycine glycyltransferase (peptidoglycan interpeptide bridge formation enzyme)
MNIRFLPFQEVPSQQWSQFVDDCEECWIYHKPELINIHLNDSRSFAIYNDNTIIGVCVLYVNKLFLGRILGYRTGPAGLALKKNVPKKVYPLIQSYLNELARANNCLAIQMSLSNLAKAEDPSSNYLSSNLGKLGFSMGLRYFGTDYLPSFTSIINLTKSLEEISKDFYELVKRKCARFRKQAHQLFCFEDKIPEKNWDEFESNHRATFKKTGATPFSRQTLDSLRGLLENGLALLLNVYVDNKCCASLYLMTYKKRATYFASGTDLRFYDSGVTAYIHQLAIIELKKRGYLFYEMGQFFPSKALEGSKLHSIGQFKKMFGNEKQLVLSGELILNEFLYFFQIILPGYIKKFIRYFWKRMR